jgi:hypothetical protein
MDELPEHKYIPLPTADHFRLLELLPVGRHSDDTLRCRLLVSALADARNTYTAISYVWGDNALPLRKPIICDGSKALITPTLHSALTRLRYVSSSRLLWADALCIDQTSNQERSQQVQLMRQIYTDARSVVVDLGEVEERDEKLLECFCALDGISRDDWVAATAKFNYSLTHNPVGSTTINFGRRPSWIQSGMAAVQSFVSGIVYGYPSLPHWEKLFNEPQVWTGFERFLARPWFGRLWVIQEFALARQVNVLVGSSVKSEKFLSDTLSRMRTHFVYLIQTDLEFDEETMGILAKESHTSTRHGNLFQKILEIRHDFVSHGNPHSSMPDAFTRAHMASCSDPRDKVYGLLGLVSPEDAAEIQVDYAEPAEKLAFRITTRFFQAGQGVYALYNASGCNSASVSWILSLHHREKTDALALLVLPDITAENMPYSACGSTEPSFRWDNVTQKLFTEGYPLGYLSDMTDALVDSVNPGLEKARLQWQLQTPGWIEKHKLSTPFIAPKINGPRTPQTDNYIRQLNIKHNQARKTSNDAFELACWTTVIADIIFSAGFTPQRATTDPRLPLHIQAYQKYLQMHRMPPPTHMRADEQEAFLERTLQAATPYLRSLFSTYNRRLSITEERLVCLVPEESMIGDAVFILLGCPIPFVLRPCGDEWRIVGCCYVHEMMDGQALQMGLMSEDITIC